MTEKNLPLKGVCLCGAVEFSILEIKPKLYQCHCSLCRKVTGFKSDFCQHCGSPVPNTLRDGNGYWVPTGLLEETENLELIAHLFVDSKAAWDDIDNRCPHYEEMPEREELKKMLK